MKKLKREKQGFVAWLNEVLFGDEILRDERNLQTSWQEAQMLCESLSSWSVKAKIMGAQHQTVIVEIANSPIQQVHIIHYNTVEEGIGLQTLSSCCLIVPDSRHLPKLEIKAFLPVRRRNHGWIDWIKEGKGNLIKIRWQGNDRGTGIPQDPEIKGAIMSLINELGNAFLTQFYYSEIQIMKIQTRLDTSSWIIDADPLNKEEHWRRYENIATRLLALDIPEQHL